MDFEHFHLIRGRATGLPAGWPHSGFPRARFCLFRYSGGQSGLNERMIHLIHKSNLSVDNESHSTIPVITASFIPQKGNKLNPIKYPDPLLSRAHPTPTPTPKQTDRSCSCSEKRSIEDIPFHSSTSPVQTQRAASPPGDASGVPIGPPTTQIRVCQRTTPNGYQTNCHVPTRTRSIS